jgi:hypothetical protein
MSTWTDELRDRVVGGVAVTNQEIAAAEAFFAHDLAGRGNSSAMLARLAEHHHAVLPKKVSLNSRGDNTPVVSQLAQAISIAVAGVEAIWRLIHRDQLLTAGVLVNLALHVGWETDTGTGSGWQFTEYEIPYPTSVMRAPSRNSVEVLCNHDLYIHELAVPGLSEEVERALREAVQCFAAELYTPCAAMLGSASEGAWLELGHSLAEYVSASDIRRAEAMHEKLGDCNTSIARKARLVHEWYCDKATCGALWEESEVRPKDLLPIMIWSDTVRDSRNSVHHAVDPRTPNTREKLVALLLGAVPFFRTLYRVGRR